MRRILVTRRRRPLRRALVLGLIIGAGILGAAACDTSNNLGPCACTLEFRFFTVAVVDEAGAPVPDLELVVTRVRDGFVYGVVQDTASGSGVYMVFNDNFVDEVRTSGEQVRVVAAKDGVSVEGAYVFSTDECRCHISKVSGPDTLIWSAGS